MKLTHLLLAGLVLVASGCTAPTTKDYSSFVACLNEKPIKEYGAYWCPNCARVRLSLGDAYTSFTNYHECDPKCVGNPLPDFCKGHPSETDACLALGIDKYPTWTDVNNKILYVGTDLVKVSEATGCEIPA